MGCLVFDVDHSAAKLGRIRIAVAPYLGKLAADANPLVLDARQWPILTPFSYMSEMNGLEFLAAVREIESDLPFILFT